MQEMWDGALEEEGSQRGLEINRGEEIEKRLEDKMMTALNNGKRTHTNRRTDKIINPMTVIQSSQAGTYEWEILEQLGGSRQAEQQLHILLGSEWGDFLRIKRRVLTEATSVL